MQTKFKAIVDELFRSLGLDAPQDVARLVVGDVELTIRQDPYARHLLVEVEVGALSKEPTHRARQIEDVLQSHLGSILDHQAVVTFDPDDRSRLIVVSSVPHGIDSGERLRIAVEDTATLATRYRLLVDIRPTISTPKQGRPEADLTSDLIFRA